MRIPARKRLRRVSVEDFLMALKPEEWHGMVSRPLVVGHLAWMFAKKAEAWCAQNRVETLKKASRLMRQTEKDYRCRVLGGVMAAGLQSLEAQTESMAREMATKITVMEMTISNAYYRLHPETDMVMMRSDAYLSQMLCRLHKRGLGEALDGISRRHNLARPLRLPSPEIKALGELLSEYTGGVDLSGEQTVSDGEAMMWNELLKITFV